MTPPVAQAAPPVNIRHYIRWILLAGSLALIGWLIFFTYTRLTYRPTPRPAHWREQMVALNGPLPIGAIPTQTAVRRLEGFDWTARFSKSLDRFRSGILLEGQWQVERAEVVAATMLFASEPFKKEHGDLLKLLELTWEEPPSLYGEFAEGPFLYIDLCKWLGAHARATLATRGSSDQLAADWLGMLRLARQAARGQSPDHWFLQSYLIESCAREMIDAAEQQAGPIGSLALERQIQEILGPCPSARALVAGARLAAMDQLEHVYVREGGDWLDVSEMVVFRAGDFHYSSLPQAPSRWWNLTSGFYHDLATAIARQAAASVTGSSRWEDTFVALAVWPLAELALLPTAIALMPWLAGGDRAGSVFKRSLKHVYWSTSICIPIGGLIAIGIIIMADSLRARPLGTKYDWAVTVGIVLAYGIFAFLLLRMLFVGAARYVGPAIGPAFAPREPRCEQCGYLIVRLPMESRCPECGLAVRASLPGGRRQPTRWQQREFSSAGFRDLLRLQWQVVFRGDFFTRLPVHEGLPAARHFWWITWCLMVAVSLTLAAVLPATDDEERTLRMRILMALVALLLPLAVQSVMMFAGCLWGQIRHGIMDYRCSAVVCYHTSPFLWPIVLSAVLGEAAIEGRWFTLNEWSRFAWMTDGSEVVVLVFAAVVLVVGLWWWWRLAAALQRIRFANV